MWHCLGLEGYRRTGGLEHANVKPWFDATKSLEGYRRTGGLEQVLHTHSWTRSRVWKVTAEQADWNCAALFFTFCRQQFGRLPPNRRIGTQESRRKVRDRKSLEGYRRTGGLEPVMPSQSPRGHCCYRRTGGLEHFVRDRSFLTSRVWKVTAEQADWNWLTKKESCAHFSLEGYLGRQTPNEAYNAMLPAVKQVA